MVENGKNKYMEKKKETMTLQLNVPIEISKRLGELADREHRKKQDQAIYILDQATKHIRLAKEKKVVAKTRHKDPNPERSVATGVK